MRYKGQSKKAAMMLFGLPKGRVMETPEQRRHMVEVLRLSHNPQIKLLVTDADPTNPFGALHTRDSFAKLCESNALTWKAVADEYVAIQKSLGMVGMASNLPEIMRQTSLGAMVRDETCPRCRGKNPHRQRLKNMKYGDCPKCSGTGVLRVDADPDKLKLVFITFGLTAINAGTSVNQTVNVNVGQSMEDLSRDVAGIIEGKVGGP